MKKTNAVKLFISGLVLILASPFYSSLIMRIIYFSILNEANFLEQRFAYFQQTLQLCGVCLCFAGLAAYICNILQTRKDKDDEKT